MGFAIAASSKRRREDSTPDINVTPLVDVVLVLLIIFMVIAPSLENGERVELPGILQPDKKQKSKLDPVTVTVAQSGKIFIEKEVIEASALAGRLAQIHDAEPDRRVVLKGDSAVDYQKIRDLFTTVQNAGFSGVSLMVSKKGPAGPEEDEE